MGFQPKAVIFFAYVDSTTVNSWGFDVSDGRMCVYRRGDTDNSEGSSTDSILLRLTAANMYKGVINSFDSDGFTVSWTKNGSPTGTGVIVYMAFR